MRNLFENLLPTLAAAEDGFLNPILVVVSKPEAVTRALTGRHSVELNNSNVKSLNNVYNIIDSLSQEAQAVFEKFDADLCEGMNKIWRERDDRCL